MQVKDQTVEQLKDQKRDVERVLETKITELELKSNEIARLN